MWKWEKKGVREGEIKERKISNDMLSSVSRNFLYRFETYLSFIWPFRTKCSTVFGLFLRNLRLNVFGSSLCFFSSLAKVSLASSMFSFAPCIVRTKSTDTKSVYEIGVIGIQPFVH